MCLVLTNEMGKSVYAGCDPRGFLIDFLKATAFSVPRVLATPSHDCPYCLEVPQPFHRAKEKDWAFDDIKPLSYQPSNSPIHDFMAQSSYSLLFAPSLFAAQRIPTMFRDLVTYLLGIHARTRGRI